VLSWPMLKRTVCATSILLLGFGATGMKFVHLNLEKVSDCLFQSGICDEKNPIYLDDQRGLGNLLSTSTGDISIELAGHAMTSSTATGSLR
jgi:hypothetical protein